MVLHPPAAVNENEPARKPPDSRAPANERMGSMFAMNRAALALACEDVLPFGTVPPT